MFQTRIHGRGGQGVVTAAELLAVAAFSEGRFAQAFPSFGSERTGAPVVSFCRFDDHEIRTREPVMEPDAVVVQDVTLLRQVDVFAGLRENGFVLVNTTKSFEELGLDEFAARFHHDHLLTCPASELALARLGRPLPNAALLGGFAALCGEVSLDAIATAIRERFSAEVGDKNVLAATDAYNLVRAKEEELHHASTD